MSESRDWPPIISSLWLFAARVFIQQLEVEEEEDEQAMGQEQALGEEPVA